MPKRTTHPKDARSLGKRCGLLLYLTYVMATNDLHGENVVIDGDQPVAVDLECLFTPTVHPLGPATSETIGAALLAIGLLPSANVDPLTPDRSVLGWGRGRAHLAQTRRLLASAVRDMTADRSTTGPTTTSSTHRRRLLLAALALAAMMAVVGCSSDANLGQADFDFTAEIDAETARFYIARGMDPRELGGVRPITGITDEQIERELAAAIAENERERAETQAQHDTELSNWTEAACPAGGPTDRAFFDPQPWDGRPVDIEPAQGWFGYEIVHVADIALPTGRVLESSGESMARESTPEQIAEPGVYPFFMALSSYGDARKPPALAQLVIDPTSTPVRWEDDYRFGFGTDGAEGWLGSPEAADQVAMDALFEVIAYRGWADDRICYSWQRDDGANFVRYFNGWGGGFSPGAAGYDEDDNLVAITWFFGFESWVLAGIPGTPPDPVLEALDAN